MAFTFAYLFLLLSILQMGTSGADPLIDVNPSVINMGTTSLLDITCTFSLKNHADIAALISLVLSRANATGQDFGELAAITEFSPNSVDLLTQEEVSASGVHSQTGESRLQLKWEYPTALQGGVYKCSAHSVDNIGHNIEMINTVLVTVEEADQNDIFNKLKQLELHEASMASTISTMQNQISVLEYNKTSLENTVNNLKLQNTLMALFIQNMEKTISHLESTVPLIQKLANWIPLGKYQDQYYYLSTQDYSDVNAGTDACKTIGADLALINDKDEYEAIKGFLGFTSGIQVVQIAGTDEVTEGHWVIPNTDTVLPFTTWATGPSEVSEALDCLGLSSSTSWLMTQTTCSGKPTDGWRYMCELSNSS